MNKLLRNPWVVMALVVGMAVLWWVQMRSIWMPGGVAESSSPVAITAEVALDTTLPETGASEPLILALEPNKPTELRWDKVPARDPFGPITALMPTPPAPASEDAESAPAQVAVLEPTLALEAVLNTPSAQIAVIDGRIVRVGDKVGGRAVLRIDDFSVALGSSVQWPQPLVLKLPNR
jgi:hypothetical protein